MKESNQARDTHILETAGKDKSRHRKKATERGVLTSWGPQRVGQVRIRKESSRARGTYQLETAEGGTSQGTERK